MKLQNPVCFNDPDLGRLVEYPPGTEVHRVFNWKEVVPLELHRGFEHSTKNRGLVIVWLDGFFRALDPNDLG